MRRIALLSLLGACGPAAAPLTPGPSAAPERPATRILLVGLEDVDDRSALEDAARPLGGAVTWCFEGARVCFVHFPLVDTLPVDAVRALPGVRYAEVDAPMTLPAPLPRVWTDPAPSAACPDPWDTQTIDLGVAWTRAASRGAVAPVVSVMDSGFLTTHDELQGVVWGGWDYGNSDAVPEVESLSGVPAHGTFISGVIAGVDDGQGRTGVLPDGRLNLQKIADDNGALYFSYAVRALGDAAEGDLGIRVINYSIASSSTLTSFQDAVEALGPAGILFVAAAGNCSTANCADANNDQTPLYPASFSFDHVVSVAGHLRTGELNPYSHYGATSVDLAAPGVDLCGPGVLGDSDYYTSGGTSYATPLVAGTAALVLGTWPRLTPVELARVLRASAVDHPGLAGLVRSGGALSAAAALDVAVPRLEAPPDRVIDRYGTWTFELDNAGAAGVGTLVLTHDPGLESVRALDAWWTTHTYAAGERVPLPDAPAHTATRSVTVLEGPLGDDARLSLTVELRARATGSFPVTARLVATSPGTNAWLNAPYDEGADDESGFLAYTFYADASAALPTAALTLTTTALVPGRPLRATVSGADPGDAVWLAGGTGPANGLCPALSERCAHLAGASILQRATADAAGEATFTLPVPAAVPAGVGLQAVAPGPPMLWSEAVFP